jgi:hypothetical protein
VNQQWEAWSRLEAELKSLETVSIEHSFQAQLAEVRGHVSLERLKAALLAIKVQRYLLPSSYIQQCRKENLLY